MNTFLNMFLKKSVTICRRKNLIHSLRSTSETFKVYHPPQFCLMRTFAALQHFATFNFA